MRVKGAGKAPRHPLWGKKQFLEDLRKYRTIKKVCEIYADKKTGWRGYYTDQWRWRKEDEDFDSEVKAILNDEGTARPDNSRPRNDGGDKSWQPEYCAALVQNRLALDKAAAVTPYTVRQIQEFLTPGTTSYDQEFEKMVEEAELVFASRVRENLVDFIGEEHWQDLEQAKVTKDRAWFNLKLAEKLEPKKFGQRKLEISGSIEHRHQHKLMPREERLALLDDDRTKYMENRSRDTKRLQSGEREEIAIIDAELVSDGG